MTNLSRPFQVVLAVLALFVALWFVALRAHKSSTSNGANASSSVSHTPKPAAQKPAAAPGSGEKAASHANTGHTPAAADANAKHATTVEHSATAAKPASKPASKSATSSTPRRQSEVEHELKQGKTVLILFWTPHGSEDVAVHQQLPVVQHKLGKKVAVHSARASQVGDYGTVTHAVQVNQTPTLLIVNRRGQTTTVTGLTDAFAIEQAIAEANS
jgi:hypothetical protein